MILLRVIWLFCSAHRIHAICRRSKKAFLSSSSEEAEAGEDGSESGFSDDDDVASKQRTKPSSVSNTSRLGSSSANASANDENDETGDAGSHVDVDHLWASLKESDTGDKPLDDAVIHAQLSSQRTDGDAATDGKVSVTETYDYAGEEVKYVCLHCMRVTRLCVSTH